MKKYITNIATIIFSFLISFFIIISLLSILDNQKNSLTVFAINSSKNEMEILKEKYMSCVNLENDQDQLNCMYPNENNTSSILSYFPIQNLKSDSNLIQAIYFLLIAGLALQIYISITSFLFKENPVILFYFSEWAINTPPMLGVLGTVIAFSTFVSSQEGDLSELFTSSFFDAAKTTVLGGFIYVINLFLNSSSMFYTKSDI